MKTFASILAVLALICLLPGCATDSSAPSSSQPKSKLQSPNSTDTEVHGSITVGAGASF